MSNALRNAVGTERNFDPAASIANLSLRWFDQDTENFADKAISIMNPIVDEYDLLEYR